MKRQWVITLGVLALVVGVFGGRMLRRARAPAPRTQRPATSPPRSSRGVELAWAASALLSSKDVTAAVRQRAATPSLVELMAPHCPAGNDTRCGAAKKLAAGCDGGDGEACNQLADLFAVSPHAGLAFETLVAQRTCAKVPASPRCQRVAELERWARADGDTDMRAEADKACHAADALACAQLAVALELNDRAAALGYAQAACEGGVVDLGGCADVALWSADAVAIEFMLHDACGAGSADACWVLGHFLGGACGQACVSKPDPKASYQAFADGCKLMAGHQACIEAARDGK